MAERKTITEIYDSFPSNQTGAITAERLRNFVKSSFANVSDRAPDFSDDENAGYNVGDHWKDNANDTIWVCLDNSPDSAVWEGILTSGTGDFDLEAISIEEDVIKGTTSSGLTISDNTETTYATFDEGLTLASPYGVEVIGDFYQSSGTSFVTESEKVRVYDSLSILNKNEVGAGVTEGFSGWEVDRGYEYTKGNATPFRWGFDETRDRFVVGESFTELEIDTVNDFILNEKIVGQASSAVGYVYSSGVTDNYNYLRLKDVNGTFEQEQIIGGESGSSGNVVFDGVTYYDNTQTIATVADDVVNDGIMYWNSDENYIENSSGLTFSSGATISEQLVVGTATDVSLPSTGYTMYIEGDTRVNDDINISTTDFTTGWNNAGGYRLTGDVVPEDSKDESNLIIDNLTVRRRMDVYELLINQIRATNGNMFVTSAAKCKSASSGSITFEDPDGDGSCPFLEDDLILSQTFEGTSSTYVEATVTNVNGTTINVSWNTSPSSYDILEGSTFVRVGNISDSGRRDSIYIATDDNNTPFIDFSNDVNSWNAWSSTGTTKVRLGRLDGIHDSIQGQLSGYGMYSNRLYISSMDDSNYITFRTDEGNSVMDMAYGGDTVFKFDAASNSATLSDWSLNHDLFYSLGSGTPSSNPSSGVVLDASFHGIKGYDPSGDPLFKLGDTNEISGLEFDKSVMFKKGEHNRKLVEFGDISNFNTDSISLSINNAYFNDGSSGWTDNSSVDYIETDYTKEVGGCQCFKCEYNFNVIDKSFTTTSGGYTDPKVQSHQEGSVVLTSDEFSLGDDVDSKTSYVAYFKYLIPIIDMYSPTGTYPADYDYPGFPTSCTGDIGFTFEVLVNGLPYKSKDIDPFSDLASATSFNEDYIIFSNVSPNDTIRLRFKLAPIYWYLKFELNSVSSDGTWTYDKFGSSEILISGVSVERGFYCNQYSQMGVNLYRNPEKNFKITSDEFVLNTTDISVKDIDIKNSITTKKLYVGREQLYNDTVAEFGPGNIRLSDGTSINTDDFQHGFFGTGFGVTYDGNLSKYTATVDDLYVRGTASFYEIEKNRIESIGGSFLLSNSYKISSTTPASDSDWGTGDVLTFYWNKNDENNPIENFVPNDVIVIKTSNIFCGGVIEAIISYPDNEMTIVSVSWENSPDVALAELQGKYVSRVGNSDIDSGRSNMVYMSSSDAQSPLLSMKDNVTSISEWNNADNLKVHIGKLDGICDSVLGPLSGYGMYSDSIYLSNNDANNAIVLETETPKFKIVSSGETAFQFDGNNPFISGFYFNENTLYNESSSGVVAISTIDQWDNSTNDKVLWDTDKAELLMYTNQWGTPAIWLKDDQSNGHVGMYWASNDNWGLLGKDENLNELFQLGSTNHIANWNFDSSGISKTSNNREIGLRSDKDYAFYVKNEYGSEVISVGDLPFPSTGETVSIPDGNFENVSSWDFNLNPYQSFDITGGHEDSSLKVYVDTSAPSTTHATCCGSISQTINVSSYNIGSDDTLNLSFFLYGDEEETHYNGFANQTINLKIELSYDGGNSYSTAIDTNKSTGFMSWKKVKSTFHASGNVDSIKIGVTFNLQYIKYGTHFRGSCKIDKMKLTKSVRDITLNSDGLRIFSNPNEYVELTKDGINVFGDTIGANKVEISDTLEIFGDIIVHGDTDLSTSENTAGDILPGSDDTYQLGNESRKWAEIHSHRIYGAGLYESGLKTDGIKRYKEGTILVWEENRLEPCNKSRDDRVMGVSDARGDSPIVSGAENVRVTGKVNCGDYLVTSSTEGCARKIKWFEKIMPFKGIIIAQALEDKNSKEEGIIKAMINKI